MTFSAWVTLLKLLHYQPTLSQWWLWKHFQLNFPIGLDKFHLIKALHKSFISLWFWSRTLVVHLQHSWWRRKQCSWSPVGCHWRSQGYESGALIHQSERSCPPEKRKSSKDEIPEPFCEEEMTQFLENKVKNNASFVLEKSRKRQRRYNLLMFDRKVDEYLVRGWLRGSKR